MVKGYGTFTESMPHKETSANHEDTVRKYATCSADVGITSMKLPRFHLVTSWPTGRTSHLTHLVQTALESPTARRSVDHCEM